MFINAESLILTITILAAAAVILCYLPIVRDVSDFVIKQRKKRTTARQLNKQFEQKLLAYHQEILNKIEKKVEETLAQQLTTLSGQYSKKVEETIQKDREKNHQELKTATSAYLDNTKISLGGLVVSATKRVEDELTKQLQDTKLELEDYKRQQIEKVDNEIATLVEKTVYKTLGRVLSQKDQMDLIYKALAEAKEEGFLTKNAK